MVCLLLLGRAALAAHMLLVPHDVCGHGELVHQRHEPILAVAARDATSAPTVRSVAADRGSHDHCDVVGLHEVCPVVELPSMAPALLAWTLDLVVAPARVQVSSIALLHLAPKLSPPVRG